MNGPRSVAPEVEPLLSLCLLEDVDRPQARRLAGVGVASLLANLLLLLGVTTLASIEGTPPLPARPPLDINKSTPLIFPRELTQKAPNKAEVAKEVHLEDLLPKLEVPAQRKVFTPPPAPERQKAQNAAPTLEPPTMAQAAPPALGTTPNIPAPPVPTPQIQAQEKPKLAFETPGVQGAPSSPQPGGIGRIATPHATVDDAVRKVARQGGGGLVIGDNTDEPGLGQQLGRIPAPGRQASQVELLSDPQGVDFKPYLIRVLAAVRRNWFSVIPESVRFGRQGRVVIQFSISKAGSVPKLVIANASGTEALDRAAVAGISASNPFPPLPPEFKGDQIRVQLVFSYNVPTR